ncbi:hypothetical protein [Microcoleus sp. K4-C2]|uniref:hypothetical protein n=1 Tax=Microcoleus sp. K4-C2 TaxID=2818792 RepID=UPI002FD063AF
MHDSLPQWSEKPNLLFLQNVARTTSTKHSKGELKKVQIIGDQENNILEETTENDTILGLAGNDTLNGSKGNDLLQGSSSTTAG